MLVKTIFGFFIFVLGSIIVTFPAILFFLLRCIGLKRPMMYLTYKLAQGWSLMVIAITGSTLTVSGREHIPRKGGFCLAGNHNSIFDIVLLLATVGRPFGFIAKKELAVIPILNIWILLLGGLFIDRKNIRKAIGTINKGIRRIEAGGVMLIFPEGTRAKGRGLLPFKPGALKLATKAKAPVTPVAITGSYDVFEKTYRIIPGQVSVNFAPPIATGTISGEDRRSGLSDQVYEIIDGMLKKA
jgi:1-acyl-sn-glycerol-3-phosphate acyltransferase